MRSSLAELISGENQEYQLQSLPLLNPRNTNTSSKIVAGASYFNVRNLDMMKLAVKSLRHSIGPRRMHPTNLLFRIQDRSVTNTAVKQKTWVSGLTGL